MLAKAIGYKGDARFISLHWTPYGDEVDYSDGRVSATGNWHAFLAYTQHPAVAPQLSEYNFGSSDSEATHALIFDTEKLTLAVAPVKEVAAFLDTQWPPLPKIRMSREEYTEMAQQIKKQMRQSQDIDVAEIEKRINETYALIEKFQEWLDRYLKN